jgi:hypothetical protein
MIVLGIDVGVTGAIAALRQDGAYVDVEDLPIMFHRKFKLVDGIALRTIVRRLRNNEPTFAVIEKTQPTDKIGVTTAFSMGGTLGSAVDALRFSGCKFEFVMPMVWKRAYGLLAPGKTDTEKKRASLELARKFFPEAPLSRQLDNGRAESLLIAQWGLEQCRARKIV